MVGYLIQCTVGIRLSDTSGNRMVESFPIAECHSVIGTIRLPDEMSGNQMVIRHLWMVTEWLGCMIYEIIVPTIWLPDEMSGNRMVSWLTAISSGNRMVRLPDK